MTNYTWTDNVMQSGTKCDVDKVADNLMYLKYDNSISNIIAFGTFSSGIVTLTKDKFHTITFSGASTIALPTELTSGVHYNCSLLVTMASLVTITQPTNVTWVYGVAPLLTSKTIKYRLTYETIDGGATWCGYCSTLGA